MRFVSVGSRLKDPDKAFDECAQKIRASGLKPDLVLLFTTMDHVEEVEGRFDQLRSETAARHLIGCTGEGLIGAGGEHEGVPAVMALCAEIPGTRVQTFSFTQDELEEAEEGSFWDGRIEPVEKPVFVILADPFSLDVERLLLETERAFPGAPAIGGNASGGARPEAHVLFCNRDVTHEGAVGVVLSGGFRFRTVVAQGCRPIGKHYVITEARDTWILKLGGKPALLALQELCESLSDDEITRVNRGLHVGRVINESQATFKRGDFLIRNLIDVDRETNAIAAGDLFRKGQTIQFHVRDADAARDDLKALLADFREEEAGEIAGAMLFSCNGRGERLFGVPDHDTGLVREALGEFPIAGFFCGGEIGPVGGRNFLHGFTSSIGLFLGE